MSGKNTVYLKKKGKREDQEATEVRLERTIEKMYAVASKIFHGDVKSFFDEDKNPIYSINDIVPGQIIYASFMTLPDQEMKSPEPEKIVEQTKPMMKSPPGRPSRNPKPAAIPLPPDSTPKVEKRFFRNITALESQDDGAMAPVIATPQKEVIFEEPEIINSPDIPDNRSVAPSMMTTATQAFNQMSRFGETADTLEATLNQNNYSLISSFIGEIPNHYSNLDEEAIKHLKEGLYTPPGVKDYGTFNFHTAIIGPRESGKTTLLRILSDKLVKVLISKMPSRRVAVFSYDMRELKPHLSNPQEILQEFGTQTINQLAAQFPLLRIHQEHNDLEKSSGSKMPVLSELKRVITQYAKSELIAPLSAKYPRTPPFESTIMPITEICKRFDASLLAGENMNFYLTNIFTLPQSLAAAFGFNKVHYIIDHFDEADVEIKPSGIFKRSNSISAIEFVKLMLSTGSFFIAAASEESLTMFVEPTDEESIDLRPRLRLLSTCGLCQTKGKLCALKLKLDNGKTVEVYKEDCGGCSGLLARWEEVEANSSKLPEKEFRLRKGNSPKMAKETSKEKEGDSAAKKLRKGNSPKMAKETSKEKEGDSAAKKLRKGLLLKVRELVSLLVLDNIGVSGFTPVFLADD